MQLISTMASSSHVTKLFWYSVSSYIHKQKSLSHHIFVYILHRSFLSLSGIQLLENYLTYIRCCSSPNTNTIVKRCGGSRIYFYLIDQSYFSIKSITPSLTLFFLFEKGKAKRVYVEHVDVVLLSSNLSTGPHLIFRPALLRPLQLLRHRPSCKFVFFSRLFFYIKIPFIARVSHERIYWQVSVPPSSLFKTVTVRCGHCSNLLSVTVNMRALLLPSVSNIGHSYLPSPSPPPPNLLVHQFIYQNKLVFVLFSFQH